MATNRITASLILKNRLNALAGNVLPHGSSRRSAGGRAEGASHTESVIIDPRCPSKSRGFGIISLFDGMSTPSCTLRERHCLRPKAALLAENNALVRALVCEQLNISDLPEDFVLCKHGYPVRYLGNVWTLFDRNAEALRQFLALLETHDRILIVTSSPCQDLTTAGPAAGKLGFGGKRSTAFHCVYFLFHLL